MAWNINQVYEFVKFLTKKNQSGGISASDLFYAWNAEQKAYQSDLLGRWQLRNNGKEGANTGLIENETILSKLAPFTKPTTVTISSGQGNKPSDFAYTLALRINNAKVFHVNHDQIAAMNADVIDPPSATDNCYYFTEYLGYYKFFPSTPTSAELDYIAVPTDVVWAYTFDDNNRQVYSADGGVDVTPTTGSVQPQWNDLDIIEITKRTLKTLGVRFKDGDFAQFGNSVINTGN